MKYQVIILLICGIRNSSQRNSTEGVCYNNKGLYDCCFNFEAIKGICKECRNGTTAAAGYPCRPCTKNMYGNQCIQECNCTQFQRCDSAVGCILKTSISTTYSTNTGSSNDKWIIYTLCITGLTLLTCFANLTLAYIKRRSCKETIANQNVVSVLGDFNVVDKTPIAFGTTGSNATSQDSHSENINFDCHERQSKTTGIDDDEVGYFDLYFVMKEGPNDQVKDRTSQNERLSTSSFYANVVGQDKTEYHKTYMSPNEYCIDDIYACDVAVTVHTGMECSSRPDEDAKYNMYSKVNKTLQTDWIDSKGKNTADSSFINL
ncbi:unnamed protein product [Mytilus edulis]|uniref:Uncharacterized protein n=1 Tax=Mytilus edulis TaxID=6550 RepID=A0A8S3PUN0_MYTED|nr:unnamed protein product [Mytilus edulis]